MCAIVVEPLFAQQVGGLFVFLAILAHKSVFVALHHAHALGDTALQMQVYEVVGVNVVKQTTLRVIHVNGRLPCLTPHTHVLFGERVGLLEQLGCELHALL